MMYNRKKKIIIIVSVLILIITLVIGLKFERIKYFIDLYQKKDSYKEIECILRNYKDYPTYLLNLAVNNEDTISFVSEYVDIKDKEYHIDLSKEYQSGKVPLLLQWDKRWGYSNFGSEIMAINGCGPTCMSIVYITLTGNYSMNPKEMARFAEQSGYYSAENGTTWAFMTQGAQILGLNSKDLDINKDSIVSELQRGDLIICSMGPGDFTKTGHFIVIYGYQNDEFLIHDPNSIIRSNQTWDYETLKSQIKHIWTFFNEGPRLNLVE